MSTLLENIRACQTNAELYRLSIHIENHATPTDVAALHQRIDQVGEKSIAWLENLHRMMFREVTTLQRYERRVIAENVYLYSTPRPSDEARDLVIAFCGLANRLQIPTPVFCQHMDGSRFDILVVRDTSKKIYVEGIPGYGANLVLVAERLRRDMNLDAYGSVYCIGTSGGGWASLMMGSLLKASRAIAVAGKPPALTPKLQQAWTNAGFADDAKKADFAVFERYFAQADSTATSMLALYSADNEPDTRGAKALARITGAKAVGFLGISDHNLMFELVNTRHLAAVLRHCLLGNLDEIGVRVG